MGNQSKIFDLGGLKEKLSGKGTPLLLAIGFIGIALIFLSEFWPSGTSKSSTVSATVTTDQYAKQLETKLEAIVSRISGVGRVKIMVTVGSGVEYVYEQNQKATADKSVNSQSDGSTQVQENQNNEQNPVVVDNGSGGQNALVKTEIQPQITGVVVVCDGGNDPTVVESVLNTIETALNLTANHINVCKMSNS